MDGTQATPGSIADDEAGSFDSSSDFTSQRSQPSDFDQFAPPKQTPTTVANAEFISPGGKPTCTSPSINAVWSHPGYAPVPAIYQTKTSDYLDGILQAQKCTQALLEKSTQKDEDHEHQQLDDAVLPTFTSANQDELENATTHDSEPFISYSQYLNLPDLEDDLLFPDLGI
ncbi:uncharacterized protein JN550_011238 [Neoarthrinium moseri]|uniref:uncharacterized protein n=1 Tax=Neoarthrinium moseri TaxID=1658444 RepID=UPI001FDBD218|nr:uncharacterized protein JN550_011238 [Neoarthrinium moseri]KAI1860776.1 hypothetical protein JN550_011238 [Neoarthrinium moseri]